LYVASDTSDPLSASSCDSSNALCDDNNDIVFYGGCEMSIIDDTVIQFNYATDADDDTTPSGWTCGACAGSATSGAVTLTAYVTCIDVP
jgi:hypothetical protein